MNFAININGVFYNRVTDVGGVAKLNINLRPGTYIATVVRYDTDLLCSYEVKVLSNIVSKDLVKYYKNDSQFYVTILDNEGSPISGERIVININGVFYNRVTDVGGVAKLNINLMPDIYIATVTTYFNSLSQSFKVTVLSKIISNDLFMGINTKNTFKVTLLDDKGNIAPNKNVVFNIQGNVYYRTTDGNGIAYLDLNLAKGNYIITTSSDGLLVSNKIIVDNGFTYSIFSIGNTSSNKHIAYIVGVHPYENLTHNTLLKLLPNTPNLRYCYDIYVIKVTAKIQSVDHGRMMGQLLGEKYVVPKIIKKGYNLVIDVHSNVGAWSQNRFVFAPKTGGFSEIYARDIVRGSSFLSYFTPPFSTSPKYITLPIINANIPAIIYEEYGFNSQRVMDKDMVELIKLVDNLNIRQF